MGSQIYITDMQKVPKALKSDLEKRTVELPSEVKGYVKRSSACRLGVRSATNPIPEYPDAYSEKTVDRLVESITPGYTIFVERGAFEQLDDSIPVHIQGNPPNFENIGELREAIRQAEEDGYKIMYETNDDSFDKLMRMEKTGRS